MYIKRFEGRETSAVMKKVREELGPEALVLSAKPVRRPGLQRFFRPPGVEVVAAVDREGERGRVEPVAPAPARPALGADPSIREELQAIKGLLGKLLSFRQSDHVGHLPEQLGALYQRLVQDGLLEPIAYEAVAAVQTEGLGAVTEECQLALAGRLAGMVKAAGPVAAGAGGVVAFVGPTGVGKTTTLSKLAAYFRFMEQKKVAIVTVDTYRIAAVEQLRTYAEIIGVPLEVALSPHELREALKRQRSADLILLDTVGRSPRNDLGIAELRQLVQVAKPAETHLVLSATAKPGDLLEALDRFRPLNPTRLLFTKLDETASYGGLLSCCFVSDLPVSYLGTGQEVPDDIEEASPERIAQLVVHGGGS